MDVFDGDLESVEGAGLGQLDLLHETTGEVLEDDSVRRGEEGENVFHEVLLVLGETLPVLGVGGEVDLLGCRVARIARIPRGEAGCGKERGERREGKERRGVGGPARGGACPPKFQIVWDV